MGIRRVSGEFNEIPPGTQEVKIDKKSKRVKKVKKPGDSEPARVIKSSNQEGEPGQNLDIEG